MSRSRIFQLVALCVFILAFSMGGCSSDESRPIIFESGPRVGMVTTSEAIVSWDTSVMTQGSVNYRVKGESAFTGNVSSIMETTRHSVTITNLKPGTAYEYQVEGHPTLGSFKTSSTDATNFVFVSMADNRGQSDKDDLIALPQSFSNIIADAVKRKPVFAVNVGDLFYGKNPDRDTFKKLYTSFKKAIHPLASITPYYISPGNHEMSPFTHNSDVPGFDPAALFNEEFKQPGPLKGYEGFVFSWDFGKVHFVSIATNRFDPLVTKPPYAMYYVSDAQIAWLDADLLKARNNGAEFIFVFGHSNAFVGTGGDWAKATSDVGDLNNIDPKQRDRFWAMLAKHNIDAYVCGHRHFSDDSVVVNGVVQWMNGDSGSVVGKTDTETASQNHYTVWTVNGTTVTAALVDSTGATVKTRLFPKKQL